MERKAWFCPSCNKHHAPHCDSCPAPVDAVSTKRMPYIPQRPISPYLPDPNSEPAKPYWNPPPYATWRGAEGWGGLTAPRNPNVLVWNGSWQ